MRLHSVFDKILSENVISLLPDGEIQRCDVNMEERKMDVIVRFDKYVSQKVIADMTKEISLMLKLKGISFDNSFDKECL